MKATTKKGQLFSFFGKALPVLALSLVMLCLNSRTAHAISYASFPMGSEADGYYVDADGNMTIYTEEGLDSWLNDIESAPPTYKQKVKTLTVNEGVTVIKNFSDSMYDIPFSDYCDSLTTVRLPASLTEIGDKVFNGCDKLTTVTIAEPSNLTTIGESAFDFDTALTTINIPDSVTTIGSGAFKDCRALELDAGKLPSGLTAINDSIFESCWKMTGSLKIPDGVTSIGDNAFHGCALMTSVTIPASVASIGDNAFYGCALTSLTIPDGVASIGDNAFYYCHKLKSVTISASVTSIGASAFERCDRLYLVTMLGAVPPTLGDGSGSDNVFKDTVISTIDKSIYVPKSSIATYKSKWTQWKNYINEDGTPEQPAAGYARNLDPTAEDYADPSINVWGFTKDAIVYSVDVEWGAMTFQYEKSGWDSETHKTIPGRGWLVYDAVNEKALKSTQDAINQVTVTNHSNAGVYATLVYTGKDGSDTTGSFGGFTTNADEDDTDTSFTDAAGDVPAYLSLSTADNNKGDSEGQGKEITGSVFFMPEGIAKTGDTVNDITKWTKIGTITVGILTEEPTN